MTGEFREGEYVTPEGEPASVQRYAPNWVWVVTIKRGDTRITVHLDEEIWRRLRERPVSATHSLEAVRKLYGNGSTGAA